MFTERTERAVRGADQVTRHGHYLSRMRLSDGRSEPMSILPSKASG